jgi:hypothetical protein
VSRRTAVIGGVLVALAAPSAAAAACPTTPLSPQALTGFEHGRKGYSANNLVPTGTGVAIAPSSARNGAYGLRINAAGAAGNEWFMWPTAPRAGVVRFAMKLDSLPAGDVSELFSMDTYSKSALRIGYDSAGQAMRLRLRSAAGGDQSVGGPALVAGAWHVVDVSYGVNGTHTAAWSVDGAAQPSATVTGGAEALHYARFGTMAADRFGADYDDVLISANTADYPVGDGRVQMLRPNGSSASGTAVRDDDGTPVDAGSWARLDEVPAISTVDFLQQTKAASTNYAQIAFEDTSEACARAVRGYFTTHSQATNNANSAKLSFFDGARESVIKSGDWAANNGLSRDYSATVAPVGEWSQTALNGLVARFGYSTDVKPLPILDGVLVEYEVPVP